MIPQECRKGAELYVNEVDKFYCWVMDNFCSKGFVVTYPMISFYIEPLLWNKKYGLFPYLWSNLGDMPLRFLEARNIYDDIMKNCVTNNAAIMEHPNLCSVMDGDKVLTKLANGCIIPRLVPQLMLKVPQFIDWSKSHCYKVEDIVKKTLVLTRSTQLI